MSDPNKVDDAGGRLPKAGKTRGDRGKKQGAGASGGKARNSNWGRVLRTAYDDTLREPVPDDFRDLLGKLD